MAACTSTERGNSVRRYVTVIRLRPGKVEEYKRLHSEVWPDALETITRNGVGNFTIFLKEPENLPFWCVQLFGQRLSRIGESDRNQSCHAEFVEGDRALPAAAGNPRRRRMVGIYGKRFSSGLRPQHA